MCLIRSTNMAVKFVSSLLEKNNSSVLFMLRDDKPGIADPGMWGFISGRLEKGETYKAAACREIKEETGLIVSPHELTPFITISRPAKVRKVFLVFGNWEMEEIIKGEEGQKLEFIPLAKIPKLHIGLDQRYLLSLLQEKLKTTGGSHST